MKSFTVIIFFSLIIVILAAKDSIVEIDTFELAESPEPSFSAVFRSNKTLYGTIGVGVGVLIALVTVSQCCCKRQRSTASARGYDRV